MAKPDTATSPRDGAVFQLSAEERLRIACRAAAIGVWQWDIATGAMEYGRIGKDILGFPADAKVTIDRVRAVTHPEDLGRTSTAAQRALDPAVKENASYTYRILREDTGALRWVQAFGEAQFLEVNGQETPVLYVGTLQDITDQKLAEERQTTLTHELKHRLLNAYSVMGVIAKRSWAGTNDSVAALLEFQTRLHAMGRVTELLFASDGSTTSLCDLMQAILAPYRSATDDRFVLHGEDVPLARKVADTLALALHELSTNAAKYGALSGVEGSVNISWTVDTQSILTLRWVERGGPPVAPPARRGFGTRLLENALASPPDQIALRFDPEGVHCTVEMALF